MLHWAFLSLLAMSGSGGITPEIALSRDGDTFIKFHNDTSEQQFCEVNWAYGTDYFWLRPHGHSEWIKLERPYEVICGSFLPDPDDRVQLGGPEIEQGGGGVGRGDAR